MPERSKEIGKVFSGKDFADLSKYSTRLCEQFNALPADVPLDVKAAYLSKMFPNNPYLEAGRIPTIGLNVPNIRGSFFVNYGINVFIHPSVFIQGDVKILDTPVSRIEIGENSAIGFRTMIIAVGHPDDKATRSLPISQAGS